MCLLTLQFCKGIADVNALYGRRIELAVFKCALRGFLDHV
jgi:hypothetical protein